MAAYRAKGVEPGKTALEARQLRIEQTKKIIQGITPAPYKKVLATVAINMGIREDTAREYIRMLLNFGFITEDKESTEKTVKVA